MRALVLNILYIGGRAPPRLCLYLSIYKQLSASREFILPLTSGESTPSLPTPI
jgi:hypothetical protein